MHRHSRSKAENRVKYFVKEDGENKKSGVEDWEIHKLEKEKLKAKMANGYVNSGTIAKEM